MDIKQLRYFVAICDAGSITRAAQTLHVAQPALSNHISKMEAQLGVELLHRTSHGVTPSESGEILYASAKRILRDVNRIADEINALKDSPAGDVIMGVSTATANFFGHTFIKHMRDRYPGISLYFSDGHSADIYKKLLTGELDIGIFYTDPDATGINSKLQIKEELFVAMARQPDSPDTDKPISSEELRKLPFVFPREAPFSIRKVVEAALGDSTASLQVIDEINSFIAVKKLVAEGLACTILPWSALYDEIAQKRITIRPIEGIPLSRSLHLCTALDRPLANSIEVTCQMAKEVSSQMIETGQWRYVSVAEARD